MWMVFYVILLAAVVLVGQVLPSESQETSKIIYKIINKYQDKLITHNVVYIFTIYILIELNIVLQSF